MKFYYSPGVCSLASHIVLREAAMPFAPMRVDLRTHTFNNGADDYYALNPRGYVPLLELADGQLLSEGPLIMQYVGDQVPEKGIVPAWGSMERYRLIERLAFISSELHKNFGPLFDPRMPQDVKAIYHERICDRFGWLEQQLNRRDYMMGAKFSVADAYLFVVCNWGKIVGVDLTAFENLQSLLGRIATRPSVQEALQVEGLV
ncbi:glutathione transferase GstA [Neorhizobium alkalisoli]|uniref:glutathione transferase GstA n=1 Tax=Neorhizobium alkalisoli TaxID=528178 RepID=UPI000CFA3119|nr:glutathione transferase GstA [Neorhizobium alkalisoli]